MTEPLTKEDIKQAVREAMGDKLEVTFGIDCFDPRERDELRADMAFLRAMRVTARAGGEKIFFWVVGVCGAGAVAWFWPQMKRYIQ